MIASELLLTRDDMKKLSVTDAYSVHRVVYDLFSDIRSNVEKHASNSSGILYADKGIVSAKNLELNVRRILIVSNRAPGEPKYGTLNSKPIPNDFLGYKRYAFEVIINPSKRDRKTGKTVALREGTIAETRLAIETWFIAKAPESWGFSVNQKNFQIQEIGVQRLCKSRDSDVLVTQHRAILKGELVVSDAEKFARSFKLGIGRGRAFGFGLLQIAPLADFSIN